MNILYIWDADYPWDVRVDKICSSLALAGHDVHIAARNLKQQVLEEEVGGAIVHRMPYWRNKKFNYISSFPFFFNPRWIRFLQRLGRHHAIDLIIVRDLPLAIAAVWTGKYLGIPVVFDMAEDYVALLRNVLRRRRGNYLNYVVRNPYFAQLVQRYTFRQVEHTLVVVDEAKAVATACGAERINVTVVMNTPKLSDLQAIDTNNSVDLNIPQNKFSAIYTGGLQIGRGIQIVLEAIPNIVERIPNFHFVVVGTGYAADELAGRAKHLGVERFVQWVGWVDHCEIYRFIRACQVGVVPHFVSDHVNTTIPNKIFDYMGCALPVLTSNAVPLKRIVESSNAGLSFKDRDPKDCAEKMIALAELAISTVKTALKPCKKYSIGA